MAEFIRPVIEKLIGVLAARTPGLLAAREPFTAIGKQYTGVAVNFPACWVMAVRTEFDPDIQGMLAEAHTLTVKFGVAGTEPDQLAEDAMAYMKAVDQAITASVAAGEWQALRVFVRAHDYGPLWERGNVIARFPELELIVETTEV